MAQVKRAKWVEGITQSNRILRDIAEIATSALRTEEGIAKEENWELVYPRPFEEFEIVRGRLLKASDGSRKYKPLMSQTDIIRLEPGVAVPLLNANAVPTTLKIFNEDRGVEFIEGTDYTYDKDNNTVTMIEGGEIEEGAQLFADYGTEIHRILESIPVKVEKVLKEENPEREISPSKYVLDYDAKSIRFNSVDDVPATAAYFMLTYTEVIGSYTRTAKEKVRLVKDLLDPDLLTYKLDVAGQIAGTTDSPLLDSRKIAEGAGTATGIGNGGAIQYTFTEDDQRVKFLAGQPPELETNQRLKFNVYYSTDPVSNASWDVRSFNLAKDTTDDTGATYIVIGSTTRLNIGMPHHIFIETDVEKPVLHQRLSNLDAGFETLPEELYSVNFEDPQVTVLAPIEEDLIMTFTARAEDDLTIGLNKITDRVVLKTITQPEQHFEKVIGMDYGAVDTSEELEMFVELQKPNKLVNPETGLTRYSDHLGIQYETQDNNHYIQMRMYDKWDDRNQKAQEQTYNVGGEIVERGAYISDWVKYSWFKDWKEYMVDELDEDSGSSNVADGIIYKEIQVTGMNEEFPIQFWLSTNNNRIALVLMGDPSLDQDNFLTSFAYLGRIHPFFSKECIVKKDQSGTVVLDANGDPVLEERRTYFQNDVKGNFALTAGSSSLPAAIGVAPRGMASIEVIEPAVTTEGTRIVGELYDYSVYSYVVTYLTEVGESVPTALEAGRLIIPRGTVNGGSTATQGMAIKIRFRLPQEATGYRIYRFHDANKAAFAGDADKHTNYKLVTSNTKLDRSRVIEYVDEGSILPMYKQQFNTTSNSYDKILVNSTLDTFYSKFITAVPTARSNEAITRDKFTGAIIDVKFSDKWGKDTATGVNDIMMFATRSGLKYQRHNAAFISTEEFMRKEKSGQSRWTGKFHLSPIYVEHSYDKQRGWLDGVMAVDDSGIEHLDELIVDKDTPTEEVYKFFRVNAPYSMFNNSPNYSYGLAIIKSSLRWD